MELSCCAVASCCTATDESVRHGTQLRQCPGGDYRPSRQTFEPFSKACQQRNPAGPLNIPGAGLWCWDDAGRGLNRLQLLPWAGGALQHARPLLSRGLGATPCHPPALRAMHVQAAATWTAQHLPHHVLFHSLPCHHHPATQTRPLNPRCGCDDLHCCLCCGCHPVAG